MSVMPGVHLMRFGWRSRPLISTQFPCMALVLQGVKSVEFGGRHLEYGAGQYLLSSVDLPAASRIVSGSKKHPLLAVAVEIHFDEMKDLVQRWGVLPQSSRLPALTIFDANADLMEAVVRLLRLLDRPEQIGPLAPLVRQEIFYHLLSGPAGSRLLDICRSGSPSARVGGAISWLREHFAEPFMVADLARHVGMSPASFHEHFKAVTGMTPIHYQKRLRLQEARKGLLLESLDIGEASFRVGYQSHSQFSKDYRRYFGRLPKDDVQAHLRNELSIEVYLPELPATARGGHEGTSGGKRRSQ